MRDILPWWYQRDSVAGDGHLVGFPGCEYKLSPTATTCASASASPMEIHVGTWGRDRHGLQEGLRAECSGYGAVTAALGADFNPTLLMAITW